VTRRRSDMGRAATAWAVVCLAVSVCAGGQTAPYERTFPQSKATIEAALKQMQSGTAGRLPELDGFAAPGERPLERFQRGYYQCVVQIATSPSGGSVVRVSAKITAWYSDPAGAKSGYQALPSNGRLEADFLDRLADALGSAKASVVTPPAVVAPSRPKKATNLAGPAISASLPQTSTAGLPEAPDSVAANNSSPFKVDAASEGSSSVETRKAVTDRKVDELRREALNLEEILRNQSHPDNLVAVKKSGTPIFASPTEGAKVMFEASAEDEFEMLDVNANWVHVRVSGLSRGWVRRSAVEMPDAMPEVSDKPAEGAPNAGQKQNAPLFQIETEETAAFPGDWAPLRGQTVKIVSVQKTNENATGADAKMKLEFAKTILDREYVELTKSSTSAAGVVVVFDSADGGMMATTLPVLQQWKAGTLSDEALWHRCYFDPPEVFGASASR
jgi:hypothetical protein